MGIRLSVVLGYLSLSPSLSRSCVVTVEPLSRQQVGLLGTQRGWPPGSTDTTITIIASGRAQERSGNRNNNRTTRQHGESVSLVTGLLLVFPLSNLPCRTTISAPPRPLLPTIINGRRAFASVLVGVSNETKKGGREAERYRTGREGRSEK